MNYCRDRELLVSFFSIRKCQCKNFWKNSCTIFWMNPRRNSWTYSCGDFQWNPGSDSLTNRWCLVDLKNTCTSFWRKLWKIFWRNSGRIFGRISEAIPNEIRREISEGFSKRFLRRILKVSGVSEKSPWKFSLKNCWRHFWECFRRNIRRKLLGNILRITTRIFVEECHKGFL